MNKLTMLINAMAILVSGSVAFAIAKNFLKMLQAEPSEKDLYKKKIKHCLIVVVVVGCVAVGGNIAERIMKHYFKPNIVEGSVKPEIPNPIPSK